MNSSDGDFFPAVDDLREQRRDKAEVRIGRMQMVSRMAIEFCRKMVELDVAPVSHEYGGSDVCGFVIRVDDVDDEGGPVSGLYFFGDEGFFASVVGDDIGAPPISVLERDDLVESFRRAMTSALDGTQMPVHMDMDAGAGWRSGA